MQIDVGYPADHTEYLEQCHEVGQIKPTPLLLQYGERESPAHRALSAEPDVPKGLSVKIPDPASC